MIDLTAAAARMRALADEALAQYQRETAEGGEPAYPSWIDDARALCDAVKSLTVRNDGIVSNG
jgi:hypothetical protein